MAEPKRARSDLMLLACGLAVLVFGPLVAHYLGEPFYIRLFTRIAVMAIAAVSLDLILGYGGLVSFGHAPFFRIGAYVPAILAHHVAGRALLLRPVLPPRTHHALIPRPPAPAP